MDKPGKTQCVSPTLPTGRRLPHKLHSTPQQHGMILISGNGENSSRLHAFSLFFPGSCPKTGTVALFPAMDVRDDKRYRCGPLVFDPMGARAKFGEGLARMELLCRAVVMVIGQNPGEQVDDRRIALMAVAANMAARRYD